MDKIKFIKDVKKEKNGGKTISEFICFCGKRFTTRKSYITRGDTKSCGCLRYKDVLNKRFGKLLVLKRLNKKQNSEAVWLCRCDCGKKTEVKVSNLTSGNTSSCGCSHQKDLTGQKFGNLTAIKNTKKTKWNRSIIWECRCDCGNKTSATQNQLTNGRRISCGCKFLCQKGDKNLKYNHDLSDEDREKNRRCPRYRKWVKKIFERDNYTCAFCNLRGGQLNAHHLNSWDWYKKGRYWKSNGITLCKKCHIDFHKCFGYGSNTKKQFRRWMNEL